MASSMERLCPSTSSSSIRPQQQQQRPHNNGGDESEDAISSSGYSSVSGGQNNPPSSEEQPAAVLRMEDNHPIKFTPPDGGTRAWLVVLSACLCNGVIFGIINSFGVIFVQLKELYAGDDAATKASLVGSISVGCTFFLSPVSGILADKLGIRKTVFLGGLVASLGMLLSSFLVHELIALYITYGVLFGCGATLTYTPSLAILGHYFKRHIGIVNGIVTAGSSLFTMVMPLILEFLLEEIGLSHTLQVLAAMIATLMICSLSFKELMLKPPPPPEGEQKSFIAKIVHVDNWRNKKFVIWALCVPSALFGYFVPYVHIVQYVKDILPDHSGSTLVTCIGVTSGLGRLIFGKVADTPCVNRIFLQQISFILIGIVTMLLTAAPNFGDSAFGYMIALSLIMGLFDGCFITMFGPIAFDICGPVGAAQGIGFILGLCSIPLTTGPPIAGVIYDRTKNYTYAFLAAGIPPIIGAFLMFFIYLAKGEGVNDGSSDPSNEGGERRDGDRSAVEPASSLAVAAEVNSEEKQGLLAKERKEAEAFADAGTLTTAVTSTTLLSNASNGASPDPGGEERGGGGGGEGGAGSDAPVAWYGSSH